MIPQRHLLILAVLEGVVMFSAIIRIAIPGLGIDFSRQPQLIWFLATMFLSASALSQYVVRAGRLGPRLKAGEQVEEERKQILVISLAILAAAGLLSLAGPQAFEQLLG
ncbi:MAG: hypothetical protein Q8L48_06240 [Archangium sp.]|nr:hypothetical protein [Archangium sp.]